MSALRPNHREKAVPKAAGNGLIDPTKSGKYPIILSDTLLGRTQKEVFTAVRYNHKPELASEPATARLKPETPGTKANFDLSFPDGNNGMYGYTGPRTMDDNQFVLYFDPARKAFILDRVDSTFHMNVTRTPSIDNPETLRQQFEQLDTSITATPAELQSKAAPEKVSPTKSKGAGTKASSSTAAKPKAPATKPAAKSRKPDKKKEPVSIQLALPTYDAPPPPPKPAAAESAPKKMAVGYFDEDDDGDDDGLTIEYPDANKNKKPDFSPAFPSQGINIRSFSDFLRDSEADDADGESDLDEERDFPFNLPSPVNNRARYQQNEAEAEPEQMDVDSEPDFEDALEDDLEAELEKELEAANSGDAEESEVSEED